MSHCCHHHSSRRRRRREDRREHPGMVHRVTGGLAAKFGVPRKLVMAGFIVGLVVNAPLTIFVFLLALYWVDHPGELEARMERFAKTSRRFWSLFGAAPARRAAYAGPGEVEDGADDDLEFADLRREFEDLERRAGEMEAQVSSEEFHLHRELDRMRRGGEDPR